MAGKIVNTPGWIENNAGMINQDTGMINDNAGMIECSTGLKINHTGLKNDTNDTEHTANGRKKRSRERGRDSKPRNYPLHTMKNLPQFRNKSHDEVREYILQTKGVDIGSNFNWNNTMMWILIGLVMVAGEIGLWKLWQQRQERKNNESIVETRSANY